IFLPISASPNDDEVALLVEDAHPAFRSRLIAAIQLVRPGAVPAGASPAFVRATIAQAEGIAQGVDFTSVISTDRMVKLILAAIKFASDRHQNPRIEPTPEDKSIFALKLENVQDSFKYRLRLGDNTSEWRRADVLIPPVVTRLECQQVYPEYTRLGAVGRSL